MTRRKRVESMNHLLNLCRMSDSNLVTDCVLRNKINFGRILNSNLDFSSLIPVLRLLVHIYNAESESAKNEVLQMTLCKGFTDSVKSYLIKFNSGAEENKIFIPKEELLLMVWYFDSVVNILPISNEFYIKYIYLLELTKNASDQTKLDQMSLILWIDDLIHLLKTKIFNSRRNTCTCSEMFIYPDSLDFYEEKRLEPKKFNFRFESVEEYLDYQFKMLKLDYETVCREGICQVKRELRGATKEPNSLVSFYERVVVDSLEVDGNCRHGLQHLITFSPEDENKIYENLPNASKRFLSGSLVFFSLHSQFTTFVVARVIDDSDTVVNNKGNECKAIRVSVIGNPSNLELGETYYMIESTIFFEPYYQVLKAIKCIKPSDFFLKKYIVDLDFSPCLPSYLRKETFYKIGSENIDLLDTERWSAKCLNLNESQMVALEAALTNEFTLIQGPPGTGKTHLVKTIMNTLIDNKWYRLSPILLVCARNDSLDHILELLVNDKRKVVRLGSQSKNEVIKECTLFKMDIKHTNIRSLVNKIQLLKRRLASDIRNGAKVVTDYSILDSHIEYYINSCESDAAKGILSSNVDVIGATTTGAARLRHLLSLVNPEVVIIEEAAEVLEAHVIASIPEGCKHLILVGDHKQLQPRPAHIDSAEKYNMDISLFERLIQNGMKYHTLTEQYRMRPEIASLISPLIYENLRNNESVYNYPSVRGVCKSLFFIHHTYPEGRTPELFGRWNKHEGDFLLALANYLLQQGYSVSDITILSGYTAQIDYMKKASESYPDLKGLEISSIDNYQGEENFIILLSLVRSESPTIGFLKKCYRVNVALSRAKHGLYIIGNMNTLSTQSSLWQYIKTVLERLQSIGDQLPLECYIHKTVTLVKTAKELVKMRNGGCRLRCGVQLSCGHFCKKFCHSHKKDHVDYICKEQCLRFPCGEHACRALCYEKCTPCTELGYCTLPCGHSMKLKCETDINSVICTNLCKRVLDCGKHKCMLPCYQDCGSCEAVIQRTFDCGHSMSVPCPADPQSLVCTQPCNRTCDNGHECGKLCHEECGPCSVPVKILFCFCLKRTKPCYKSISSMLTTPVQD